MPCLTGQYVFLHFAGQREIDTINVKHRSVKHKSETAHRLIIMINVEFY